MIDVAKVDHSIVYLLIPLVAAVLCLLTSSLNDFLSSYALVSCCGSLVYACSPRSLAHYLNGILSLAMSLNPDLSTRWLPLVASWSLGTLISSLLIFLNCNIWFSPLLFEVCQLVILAGCRPYSYGQLIKLNFSWDFIVLQSGRSATLAISIRYYFCVWLALASPSSS